MSRFREEYVIQDFWGPNPKNGQEMWARRDEADSLDEAREKAADLLKRIGNGARVRIVQISKSVVEELS